jgi:hypothetical protein
MEVHKVARKRRRDEVMEEELPSGPNGSKSKPHCHDSEFQM